MLQQERLSQIYEILKERNSATVQYLQKRLYISEATVRRDLAAMEKTGLVERVWGGVMLRTTTKDIPSFVRINTNPEKKQKMAEAASRLLTNSSSIFFDSSTSCLALIPYLAKLKDLTVITSSLKMSYQLASHTSAMINILGGQVYENYILTGYTAVDSVRNYYADFMFFSCSGVSSDGSLWSIEPRVVEVSREMMKHSSKKVLLCDSSKFGKKLLWKLASVEDVDYVISDSPPEDPRLLDALGSKLIVNASQLQR